LPENDYDNLIKRCIAGERSAQSQLYNMYAPKMMGVCLRYGRNREEAEEILQEGFMRVFTYIKQFKGTGSLEGWIRKIMVNCALQRYKNFMHQKPVIELHAQHYNSKDDGDIMGGLHTKDLLKLVQLLTPAYRLVFNLYVFEGMKHNEIAATLGISEGTSKSNLSDARAMLKKTLEAANEINDFKIKSV
jgi:RNA polymerase sigma factor (sigma-70 family)